MLYQKRLHRPLDVHWKPQTDLCSPCALNYHYVIDFEQLRHDSDNLLAYAQRNDPEEKRVSFMSSTNMVGSSLTDNRLKALPLRVATQLRGVYREDFKALGYS